MVDNRIKNIGIYDFLKHSKRSRYVGLITTRQIASLVEIKSMSDHWSLISQLGKQMFPNNNVSYYNGDLDSYIAIFGETNHVDIDLPNSINQAQKDALISILNEIKKYENEKGISVFYDDYDHFYKAIEKAESVGLDDDWGYDSKEDLIDNSNDLDEKMVGIPISELSFPPVNLSSNEIVEDNNLEEDSHVDELESMFLDEDQDDLLFIDDWYDDYNKHTF